MLGVDEKIPSCKRKLACLIFGRKHTWLAVRDGPSPYIDFVDNMLFGGGKNKEGSHAGGCECSGCSPHWQAGPSSRLGSLLSASCAHARLVRL